MICEYFRVTGAQEAVLDLLIYSVSLYMAYDVQDFDTRWDQALLSTSEVPNDKIMESLFNMRIRGSDQTEHNTQPS